MLEAGTAVSTAIPSCSPLLPLLRNATGSVVFHVTASCLICCHLDLDIQEVSIVLDGRLCAEIGNSFIIPHLHPNGNNNKKKKSLSLSLSLLRPLCLLLAVLADSKQSVLRYHEKKSTNKLRSMAAL